MKQIIKKTFSKLGYRIEAIQPTPTIEADNGVLEQKAVKNRFEPYECTFMEHTLYVHDYASFDLGNSELFHDKIYKFKADNDRPYIIDCGANLGMSVIYFKTIYPDAEIVAFEADPYIFSFLEKNVKSYQFLDVNVINKAVWNNSDDTLSFLREGGAGGRIQEKSNGFSFVDVRTIRLKGFLNKKIDFLKIDIEGAEYNVIKDCADELKNVQNLFIEYHSFPETKQNLHDILEIVQRAGFKYYIKYANDISPAPFIEVNLNFGMDLQLNIFCYRA